MKLFDKLQVYILVGGMGLPSISAASNQAVLALRTSCSASYSVKPNPEQYFKSGISAI
jgi:hypothetical protein